MSPRCTPVDAAARSGDFDEARLAQEHQVLLAAYGRVQRRCSDRLQAQQAEIDRLQRDLIRARARVVMRETQLAWEREDRAACEAQIPGLPRRRALASHVEQLVQRVQSLMRELRQWRAGMHQAQPGGAAPAPAARLDDVAAPAVLCLERDEGGRLLARHIASHGEPAAATAVADAGAGADPSLLEASLVAADLVICQTGCVSHDAYWRVEDHCRRTGKACVLVGQPQALQLVRAPNRALAEEGGP